MSDDPYVYPGTRVLRNRLELRDGATLHKAERLFSSDRAAENLPRGDFDLAHLRAIHRHLFQDVYDWAGEIRTVEIAKSGHQFMFRRFIESGMADVHRRIVAEKCLSGLSRAAFAAAAGEIMGDVNYIHPFRDGNGRAQLLYLKQLATRAGHGLDLRRIDAKAWIEASIRAHDADYAPMGAAILFAVVP
jgi:cell filamentation protein